MALVLSLHDGWLEMHVLAVRKMIATGCHQGRQNEADIDKISADQKEAHTLSHIEIAFCAAVPLCCSLLIWKSISLCPILLQKCPKQITCETFRSIFRCRLRCLQSGSKRSFLWWSGSKCQNLRWRILYRPHLACQNPTAKWDSSNDRRCKGLIQILQPLTHQMQICLSHPAFSQLYSTYVVALWLFIFEIMMTTKTPWWTFAANQSLCISPGPGVLRNQDGDQLILRASHGWGTHHCVHRKGPNRNGAWPWHDCNFTDLLIYWFTWPTVTIIIRWL